MLRLCQLYASDFRSWAPAAAASRALAALPLASSPLGAPEPLSKLSMLCFAMLSHVLACRGHSAHRTAPAAGSRSAIGLPIYSAWAGAIF